MKTLMNLILTLMLAPVLSMGQGKVILINGDTLAVDLKKLSGSTLLFERDGLEQEMNLTFVHKVISNTGKEVIKRENAFKNHTEVSLSQHSVKTNGSTLILDHTVELEHQADNFFPNAKKYSVAWFPDGGKRMSAITNAFLTLVKKDSFIVYVNGYNDFSPFIGRYYKLSEVKVVVGEIKFEREYKWTGQFINSTDFKVDIGNGKSMVLKYEFKDNQLTYFNTEAKEPLEFAIAYMDENTIRYFKGGKYDFHYKTLVRINPDTATVSK